MRHAEAGVLKELLALERRAIAEIEKTLSAEGITPSAVTGRAEGERVVLDGVDS